MSADEVFAAQMWPWPDPLIKRDAMGRVLFINAAFLRIYGGTVDDWRGNIITGWHAPQAPGVPYRFEIRVPNGHSESVYDWIEYSLEDGTALALARDVSVFTAAPVETPQAIPQAAVQTQAQTPVHVPVHELEPTPEPDTLKVLAEKMDVAQPVHDTPAPVDVAPAAEAILDAATLDHATVESPQPVFESHAEETPQPVFEAQAKQTPEPVHTSEPVQAEAPLENILEKDDTHFTSAPEAEAVAPPVMEEPAPPQTQAPAPAPVAEQQPEARDFERRALPLENGDAVLGNNWRDAVIAKAVGAERPTAEAEAAPVTAVKQDMDAPAPEIGGNDGPLKILLAEDNAINALLTRTLLEADGCIVDTVEDGAKAVEAAKAQHYDLIFMDMRMPNMDGLESTRKIRALDNRSKSLPIIALTANAFDDDRNACFDSGMNDFMTKPVSAEELSEMVKTWTKNREQRLAS